jgi:type I restriction enzyme S subunit
MVEGFKYTDAGIIPIDWNAPLLSEISDFENGKAHEQFIDDKGDYIVVNSKFISTEGNVVKYSKVNLSPLKKGNIAIVMSDIPNGKALAKCFLIPQDNRYTLNQRIGCIKPFDEIDNDYLFYKLNRNKYFLAFDSGSGQTNLKKSEILSCPVALPPTKAEQTAIATALNDADALIQQLEQLIAKKRNIKTGAMQELLKPKEGWKWTTVDKLGKPYGGISGKSKADFKDGNCPYIPFMNVMSNPIIDTSYFDYVNISPTESQHKAEKGDLFFNGSSETPEEVGMCSVLLEDIPNLYLNSFCFGFRLFKEEKNDGLYLAYYFRSSYGRKIFYILAQGATRHNLSKSNFLKIEIQIPELNEQVKIATILRDMDNEIQALETQLAKYKLLKQGMMQVLLTGKIRLNHDFCD